MNASPRAVAEGMLVSGRGVDPAEPEALRLAARLDVLALEWMNAALPVDFRVARNEKEHEAVYRLRYEVVAAHGWADPAQLPAHSERDAHDARALHVIGWDEERLVAAARLVFPLPGHRLPTEEAFEVNVGPRGRVVNVDRVIVAGDRRTRGHALFRGLLGYCWREIRGRGFVTWTGVASAGMIRLYHSLGIQPAVLGPSRPYWGEERYPIRFDPGCGRALCGASTAE